MFDVEVCQARHVVLVRFRGLLSEDDFSQLDKLGADARSGPAFDCIFDLSAVERVDLATDFVVKRGDIPQAFKDRERIYVVPQDDLKLLVRFYAAAQAAKGWKAPDVVASIDEALSRLGVDASDFAALPGRPPTDT